MNISIIGGGEVGGCYARALTQAGHRIHALCDIDHRPAVRAVATEAGAALYDAPGPWLAESDVVISAVYGRAALEVVAASLPFMRADAVYADFTTASPAQMLEAATLAQPYGIDLVDVAIMGAIFITGDKTPLLCSGAGAPRIETLMQGTGASARAIEGQAGDAMTLKLLRSIMTKGLESLAVECLVAAERKNLRPALVEVLQDIDPIPLTSLMGSFVRSHVIHAERRLIEVQEAREQLIEDGLEPRALDGVASLFARTAAALAERRAHPDAVHADIGDSLDKNIGWLTTLAHKK